MKDFRGEIIRPGSKIVYPVRHGARVRMKEATVTMLRCTCGYFTWKSTIDACAHDSSRTWLEAERDGKKLKLTNLSNVVVVR